MSYSQGYEFGIVHITDHTFKVVAIPDFTSSGNTDISNIGFTLMLPDGNADVTNLTGLLGGRPWAVNSNATAAILQANYGGDGTEDAFLITLDPGQTLLSHNTGDQIDLVSFDVSNSPTTGTMRFLLNTETIAMNASNALDSFFQSNIDNTTTQNYFLGLASGMESFSFSVLGIEDTVILKNMSIYPNPASEFINISSSIEIEIVKVFNVLGKEVLSTNETSQLKVNHLQSGIYFLKIFANKRSATKKIVIK
ncbi:hypothetical protein A9Q86_03010 [Flavobacteriales bacterium 33_180_T64]|nr:hypothetical protein A9Q86_03010 [Flavobacteriales bacterium 33_180_T64]